MATARGLARFDGARWTWRESLRWLPSDEVRDVALADDSTAYVATTGGLAILKQKKMTLAEKADHYERLVRARHVRPPGLVEQCILKQAGDLSGKVVVSCSLPMNAADTRLVVAHTSSGAEALAKKVPGARVVSAFGTVPSEVLFAVFEDRDSDYRPSLVYSGDDEDAKATAAKLIRDVGFDPVDAGPLEIARFSEPFTLLIAKLAYEGDGGPALAYRFKHFEERA